MIAYSIVRLPLSAIPGDIDAIYEAWLCKMLHKTAHGIHQSLSAQWSSCVEPHLRSLADLILESPVQSVIVGNRRAWIHLGAESNCDKPQLNWFVGPPLPDHIVDRESLRYKMKKTADRQLRIFLHYFSGLREMVPSYSGEFMGMLSESMCERYDGFFMDAHAEMGAVADGPVLFHASNGDGLGWCPNDEFVWYVFDCGKLKSYVSSFERVVMEYVRYRRRTRECFDSYSAFEQLLGLPDDG